MSHDSRTILRETFGHDDFRPQQEDVIDRVVEGGDAFVLMPTGGGKSLCYQVPALLRSGTALVVSPLLALMEDQVGALVERGVAAAAYHSMLDGHEARAVLARLHAGELDLLYVSPERLASEDFLGRLSEIELSLLAVDEAHCVSLWGHDFRPEYARLGELRQRLPDMPLVALTATADETTRQDVRARLDLLEAPLYAAGFDRPNISYAVDDKGRASDQLVAFAEARRGRPGIVYCATRKGAETAAAALARAGHAADAYHAGLPGETRNRVQQAFLSGQLTVVAATVAFGMGIDKADVRWVLHFDLPRSVEAYYQETGRAGRDGLPSEALLLYGPGDAARQARLIDQGSDEDAIRIERAKLSAMIDWSEGVTCRRAALLGHFGEAHPGDCGNCDACNDPRTLIDATEMAQMALSCVARTGQRFGAQYVIDVLLGSEAERVMTNRHNHLSTWGIGKGTPRATWSALVGQLVARGFLHRDLAGYSVLSLQPACRAVLDGSERFHMAEPRAPRRAAAGSSGGRGGARSRRGRSSSSRSRVGEGAGAGVAAEDEVELSDDDEGLFHRLRALRTRFAKARKSPAYVVFSDATLRALVVARPNDEQELLEVKGVGPAKVERYGEAFLAVIAGRPEPDVVEGEDGAMGDGAGDGASDGAGPEPGGTGSAGAGQVSEGAAAGAGSRRVASRSGGASRRSGGGGRSGGSRDAGSSSRPARRSQTPLPESAAPPADFEDEPPPDPSANPEADYDPDDDGYVVDVPWAE